MSPATAQSPPRCSSPITQKWNSNASSPNATWSRSGVSQRSILSPIAGILFEKRQRLERSHAIEEEHAVEMVGFVLDDARRKIVRAQFHTLAVPIVGADADLTSARHASANVRNAETSFPVLDDVLADDGDIRVDDRERLRILLLLDAVLLRIERRDENP